MTLIKRKKEKIICIEYQYISPGFIINVLDELLHIYRPFK